MQGRPRLKELESGTPTASLWYVKNLSRLNSPTSTRPSELLPPIKFFPIDSEYFADSYFFRYLVPNDLTAYHFNYIIRKRIKLPEKDSLYFFVNGRNLLKGGKKLSIIPSLQFSR